MNNKSFNNRTVFITEDGFSSIKLNDNNEQFHSYHGAFQESKIVYIQNGLDYFNKKNSIDILEIGFGTGLNAILSLEYAIKNNIHINYYSIEAFPLSENEYSQLNYSNKLNEIDFNLIQKIWNCPWNREIEINSNFSLTKYHSTLESWNENIKCDIVYFDAFSPEIQPELWESKIFEKIKDKMKLPSVLTTYCAKGSFRRILKDLGFSIEKLNGPKGKREITRAILQAYQAC